MFEEPRHPIRHRLARLGSIWRKADFDRRARLIGSVLLAGAGVLAALGLGGGTLGAAVPVLLLAAHLFWSGAAGEEPLRGPKPISDEQREVLAATIERDGRQAAAKQLKMWTGDSLAEAALDNDTAFPRPATEAAAPDSTRWVQPRR